MPFLGRKVVNDVDYKARLERKLCIARDDPEPVFDISDCNLKTVPSGIYSLCKVFRKEALHMQINSLSQLSAGGSLSDLSLLQVLNLHSNQFTKLPQEIKLLKNLTIFIVSNNLLQELPDTIGELTCLVALDISNNKLKHIPTSIGKCKNLQRLNLQCNLKLKSLPKTLGYAQSLKNLLFDPGLEYPPKDVCSAGVTAILRFLLSECGEELPEETVILQPESNIDDLANIQERLQQLDNLKLLKTQERLEVERRFAEEQERELELHEATKLNKHKLVEDLKVQQQELDNEILKIQGRKDEERQALIKQINHAELIASSTVEHLLESSRKLREKALTVCEQDLRLEEELFNNFNNTIVERNKILNAMNVLVQEELLKADKLREYEAFREQTAKNFVLQESTLSSELMNKLNELKKEQTELVSKLHVDEELQRAAFATLMERSDRRSWELNQQVALVQAKLAELTRLELTKRKLETCGQINELGNSRVALTTLLLDLFNQQSERRSQLLDRLRRVERVRDDDDNDNFWLQQYQLLLESKFSQLVDKNISQELANCLILYNVFHHLPLLSNWVYSPKELSLLTHQQLEQVGVASEEDRACILKAISDYLKQLDTETIQPTAPLEDHTASAPQTLPTSSSFDFSSHNTTVKHISDDCVVCLDSECNVIFIPCGHLCCCVQCCLVITQCPLCRTDITDKIQYIC